MKKRIPALFSPRLAQRIKLIDYPQRAQAASEKMKVLILRIFFAFLVLIPLLAFMGLPSSAVAQSFSINPPILETSVAKGRKRTLDLEVEYFASSSLQIGLDLRDRNSAGFVEGESAIEWFAFDDEVTLSEGTTTIPLEITVPADAGGRYFFDLAVFIIDTGAEDQDMVRLGYNIPIDLTVTGTRIVQRVEPTNAQLRIRQLQGQFFTELTLEAENTGNDLVTFVHNYRVKRMGDTNPFLVANGTSQPVTYRPLERGSVRTLIPRRLPPGNYEIDVYLQYADRRTPTASMPVTIDGEGMSQENIESAKSQDIFSEPKMVVFELQRGATRTKIVNVRNYGTSPEVLDITVTENSSADASNAISAVKALQNQITVLPGAVQGVPLIASLPHAYPESYVSATVEFGLPSGAIVASSEVYVGDQDLERVAKYEIVDFGLAEADSPTPRVFIQIKNAGEMVEVAELNIVVQDSRLSTVHRDVLTATDFLQPGDTSTLEYDVVDRIRERPDEYLVTLSNKGEALSQLNMIIEETGHVKIQSK